MLLPGSGQRWERRDSFESRRVLPPTPFLVTELPPEPSAGVPVANGEVAGGEFANTCKAQAWGGAMASEVLVNDSGRGTVGCWGSFLFPQQGSWARAHLAPASPQEVSRPDDPPPSPPSVCSGRRGSRQCFLVNKQPVQAALSGLPAAHRGIRNWHCLKFMKI